MAKIERRLYTRVEVHIPVTIIYNEIPIANRYTKNISIGGVFIKAPDLGLLPASLINLKVQFERDPGELILPAIVSRVEKGGIAAFFETVEKATELYISLALKDSQTPIFFDTSAPLAT